MLIDCLPDVGSNYYFETRLGDGDGSVDFAMAMGVNDGRPSSMHRSNALRRFVRETPGWADLSTFLRDWEDPSAAKAGRWPTLWMGFDGITGPANDGAPPCISFSVHPAIGQPGTAASARQAASFIVDKIAELCREPLGAAYYEQAQRLMAHLPPGGQVMYGSAMLSREDRAIKLNILLPIERVTDYLHAVGWRGSKEAVGRMLAVDGSDDAAVRLDLTLGEIGHERLGVEFLSKELRASRSAAEKMALELERRGLCTSEERAELDRWWGRSSERYLSHTWATCLARSWYVKLCWKSGDNLEAKAYLGFMPRHFTYFEAS